MQNLPVLYPLFFSIWPVLCVYSFCLGNYLPEELVTAALVCVVCTLLFCLLMQRLVNDWHKASFLAMLMVLSLWSYLPFETGVAAIVGGAFEWIFVLYLVLCTSIIVLVSKSKISLKRCTQPLLAVAFLLCVFNAYPIVAAESQFISDSSQVLGSNTGHEIKLVTPQHLPDIYYVIVDAFANPTTLKEKYGYDDRSFVEFLKEKGFYVALESTSNYDRTALSIPSSLNMQYLDGLPKLLGA